MHNIRLSVKALEMKQQVLDYHCRCKVRRIELLLLLYYFLYLSGKLW